MTTAARRHYSYDDYLSALAMSDVKLEYCDGVIYAMAGGTPTHAALGLSVGSLLKQALAGRCTAYSSDLMIRIDSTDLSTYPDASVICGPVEVSARDKNAATNPAIIVEVTSKSTEDYDRGEKLSHYKQLPSVRAVLFVSHRLKQVTVVERDGASWDEREVRGGERVTVREPSLSFAVDALYSGIALET